MKSRRGESEIDLDQVDGQKQGTGAGEAARRLSLTTASRNSGSYRYRTCSDIFAVFDLLSRIIIIYPPAACLTAAPESTWKGLPIGVGFQWRLFVSLSVCVSTR